MQSIFLDPDPQTQYKCYGKNYSKGFTKLMKFVLLTKEYPELLTNIKELVENNNNKPKGLLSTLFNIDKSLLNKQNDIGMTALMLAVLNVNTCSTIDTVQLLLNLGANVNLYMHYSNETALTMCQNTETMRLLINYNINLNWKLYLGDYVDYTALMYFSINGNMNAVKVLIDNGASLDVQNKYGSTALMLAKTVEIASQLVCAGANVHLKNNQGETALTINQKKNNKQIVLMLTKAQFINTDIFLEPDPNSPYSCYKTVC